VERGDKTTWSALDNRAGMLQVSTGPLRPEANARCGLPPLLLRLTCLAPSVHVRWRSLVSVAVVTHLVTHSLLAPARLPIGLTVAGPFAGGKVSRTDSRER
jgi:hypothetical protein